MAELAVTDGRPPPDDLPRGDCICTRLADGSIRVDHADPRILISAELIDGIVERPCPAASLDLTGCTTFMGALLRIRGVNRTVVYRITEWVPRIRAYIAEWPD